MTFPPRIIRDHTGNCFHCEITNCSRFTKKKKKKKQKEKQAKTFPKWKLLVKIDNQTIALFVKWISINV